MKTTTKYQNNVFNINSYNDYFNYKNSYKNPDNVTLIKLSNNKKLGKQILVGRHKGKKLYSLTLVLEYMVITLRTDIMLVVSVPVLSEQITVVQPNVSTLGSFLTMAFLFAICLVPNAKHVVITAGRPSGIAATAKATAT